MPLLSHSQFWLLNFTVPSFRYIFDTSNECKKTLKAKKCQAVRVSTQCLTSLTPLTQSTRTEASTCSTPPQLPVKREALTAAVHAEGHPWLTGHAEDGGPQQVGRGVFAREPRLRHPHHPPGPSWLRSSLQHC